MATSFKVKLRRNSNKAGLYGIIIRVIHDRKSTDISINQYVNLKDFDIKKGIVKKSHPRQAKISKEISDAKKKLEDIVFDFRQNNIVFNVKDITASFKEESTSLNANVLFRNYMESFISKNPENLGISTLKYYKTTLNKWKKMMPGIKLNSLREKHFIKFIDKLESKGISQNTLYKAMKPIRKLLLLAKKQGLIDHYPLEHLSFKQVKGSRAYLTSKELQVLRKVEAVNKSEALAKDVFLFSIFTGLRFGDICTLKDDFFQKENNKLRLKIKMQKTKEPLEFNLSNHATNIIKKYLGRSKTFTFPILDKAVTEHQNEIRAKIESRNAYLNKHLKLVISRADIKKSISMHCGRHTFAVRSIELGADLYVLSKMLGHTSISTTEIYAKMVDKRKDELTELWNDEKKI